MAPFNNVLDNFNRADSTTTIGANWTILKNSGGTLANEGISSNQLYNPVGSFGNYSSMYWNSKSFGPDCEVFMTIATKNSANSNDNPAIYLRTNSPGASFTGYDLSYDDSGNMKIEKVVAGATTTLVSAAQAVASGDKLWFEAKGATLNGYLNHSGVWSLILTTTDTTYLTSGSLGFYIPGNTQDGRFDDFGGGEIATYAAWASNPISQPIIANTVIIV